MQLHHQFMYVIVAIVEYKYNIINLLMMMEATAIYSVINMVKKGHLSGMFDWPAGLAIVVVTVMDVGINTLYVCDQNNHKIQLLQ